MEMEPPVGHLPDSCFADAAFLCSHASRDPKQGLNIRNKRPPHIVRVTTSEYAEERAKRHYANEYADLEHRKAEIQLAISEHKAAYALPTRQCPARRRILGALGGLEKSLAKCSEGFRRLSSTAVASLQETGRKFDEGHAYVFVVGTPEWANVARAARNAFHKVHSVHPTVAAALRPKEGAPIVHIGPLRSFFKAGEPISATDMPQLISLMFAVCAAVTGLAPASLQQLARNTDVATVFQEAVRRRCPTLQATTLPANGKACEIVCQRVSAGIKDTFDADKYQRFLFWSLHTGYRSARAGFDTLLCQPRPGATTGRVLQPRIYTTLYGPIQPMLIPPGQTSVTAAKRDMLAQPRFKIHRADLRDLSSDSAELAELAQRSCLMDPRTAIPTLVTACDGTVDIATGPSGELLIAIGGDGGHLVGHDGQFLVQIRAVTTSTTAKRQQTCLPLCSTGHSEDSLPAQRYIEYVSRVCRKSGFRPQYKGEARDVRFLFVGDQKYLNKVSGHASCSASYASMWVAGATPKLASEVWRDGVLFCPAGVIGDRSFYYHPADGTYETAPQGATAASAIPAAGRRGKIHAARRAAVVTKALREKYAGDVSVAGGAGKTASAAHKKKLAAGASLGFSVLHEPAWAMEEGGPLTTFFFEVLHGELNVTKALLMALLYTAETIACESNGDQVSRLINRVEECGQLNNVANSLAMEACKHQKRADFQLDTRWAAAGKKLTSFWSFRLNGNESIRVQKCFGKLVQALYPRVNDTWSLTQAQVASLEGLEAAIFCVRRIFYICAQPDPLEQHITDLTRKCARFWCLVNLFAPTVAKKLAAFHVAYVLPLQARYLQRKYGIGMVLVSSQSLEYGISRGKAARKRSNNKKRWHDDIVDHQLAEFAGACAASDHGTPIYERRMHRFGTKVSRTHAEDRDRVRAAAHSCTCGRDLSTAGAPRGACTTDVCAASFRALLRLPMDELRAKEVCAHDGGPGARRGAGATLSCADVIALVTEHRDHTAVVAVREQTRDIVISPRDTMAVVEARMRVGVVSQLVDSIEECLCSLGLIGAKLVGTQRRKDPTCRHNVASVLLAVHGSA